MKTLITSVNHSKITITTYEMNNELANEIVNLFHKQEVEPIYSLGFNRLMSLSKDKRRKAETALILNGISINEVHAVIKQKLEEMTELEFKSFKSKK